MACELLGGNAMLLSMLLHGDKPDSLSLALTIECNYPPGMYKKVCLISPDAGEIRNHLLAATSTV
jgi:hypothetical protein